MKRTPPASPAATENGGRAPAIAVTDLRKSYGVTHAVKPVTMNVAAGTVHALVGENGAGKSTFLGMLAGRTPPSSGEVLVFDEPLKHGDPRASRRAGVVAIYQELTIVPFLSAEANVFLSGPLTRAGFLSEKDMRSRYESLCDKAGVNAAPPRTPARELSVADQQILEILRALVSEARVILLDEPTASLAIAEREALYRLIRGLRAEGVTIMFVSHNLDEVLELSDEITVFRDGYHQVTAAANTFTKASLVKAMISDKGDDRVAAELLGGGELPLVAEVPSRRTRFRNKPPILLARGVTVPGAIENVDIEVRAGEIVGIGGLVGAGRTSLLRALAGLEPTSSGELSINGERVSWPHSVRRSLRYGIALIPEDRKSQGLVTSMSAMDNIVMSNFGRATSYGFVTERSVERVAEPLAKEFGLQDNRLRHRAGHLSGGNQQKLLIARWSHVPPLVLLADEPTRGIDVGAKAEIIAALERKAENGMGIVIVSSELEEVAAVSDRVVVMSEGRQVGQLDREHAPITAAAVLDLAFHVQAGPELADQLTFDQETS